MSKAVVNHRGALYGEILTETTELMSKVFQTPNKSYLLTGSGTAAMEAGFPAIELLLQLASVGTFLSITMKMIYFIFLRGGKEVEIKNEIPKNMYVAMGIGAALCTVYGIFPDLLYRFLPFAMEYHPFTVDHIVQYIQLLIIRRTRALSIFSQRRVL